MKYKFISSTFESLADASDFSTCQLQRIRAEGGTGVIAVGRVAYHREEPSEQGLFPK